MASRHEQAVVFSATKTHIGATLWQMDVRNSSSVWRKYTHAINFFRVSTGRAIAAPAAPQVALHIQCEAVDRPVVFGFSKQALIGEFHATLVLGLNVVSPQFSIRLRAALHHIKHRLVR